MDWVNFVVSVIGTIIGGLITWHVSKRYYERASQDLKNETEGLKKLTTMILEGMEIAGLVHIARDEKGNILGYNFLKVRSHDSATIYDKPIVKINPEKPG
jgi:hypothetical protein